MMDKLKDEILAMLRSQLQLLRNGYNKPRET